MIFKLGIHKGCYEDTKGESIFVLEAIIYNFCLF